MPRESLDPPEDLPKDALCQMAFGELAGAGPGTVPSTSSASPGTSARRWQRRSTSARCTPSYPFNVMVTQDVIFPGPYKEASQE